MTKQEKQDQAEAIVKLREWLKPGDTVHTILRHVSRSGMQREVGVVIIDKDGNDIHPNYLVSKALGLRVGKRDGLIMGGCGMDMGFALIYELSAKLFPEGFGCIGAEVPGIRGRSCPSNDHSNGDRDYTPHPGCGQPDKRGHKDHWHTSGGYALRQHWL